MVEDEQELREELIDYLRYMGYQVCGVASAEAFWQHWDATAWDIVLLDLGLPAEDGLTTARKLRQSSTVGIIMMTARGQVEDRIEGAQAGSDVYLVKPIDPRELKAVIDNLMQRLRRPSAPPCPQYWQLDTIGLQIIPPNAPPIRLTGAEIRLLSLLMLDAGTLVSRQTLSAVLGRGGNPEETRRLDYVISRLRTKIEQQPGIELPIRSHRGIGYSFTASARLLQDQ